MRLIDADEYVDELKWLQANVSNASAIEIQEYIDRVNKQPIVDAVEVIRCKDCEYGEYAGLGKFMCDLHEFVGKGDFYCASGERKGNE